MFAAKLYNAVLCCTLFLVLLVPSPALADVKEITATGEYNMGESETLVVAKERAAYVAMRNAVEQAGVYLESYSQVQNMQVTKDEINMIASGIVEVTDKKFDRKLTETGGDFIKATVTCKINTDDVQSQMNRLKDKSSVENSKKVQAEYEKAMRENEELKKQLAQATTAQDKQQVKTKIEQNEIAFTAAQWFDKGYDYLDKEDYNNAILAYSKVIELTPQDADAYYNRGLAYDEKDQKKLAFADYSKTIELNSEDIDAYINRGLIYFNESQYDLAMADYDKAIELNPQEANAYYNKGLVYEELGRNLEAIAAYKRYLKYAPEDDSDIESTKQKIRELARK